MAISKLTMVNTEEDELTAALEVADWMRQNEDGRLWEIELGFHRAIQWKNLEKKKFVWFAAMKLYFEGEK